MSKKGLILIVSGPSGCGKGTVLHEVLGSREDVYYSISATTRAPRPGEENGVHYHFITKEDFEKLIAEDAMLEHAEYCGNYYGTPKQPILDHYAAGDMVILEIEVQGAKQVMEKLPQAVSLFIAPPDLEVLEHRLRKRGTEEEETIQKRLAQAKEELTHLSDYDYVIVNAALEDAVDDLQAILRAERCRTEKCCK